MTSILDKCYRSMLMTKFFTKGWGTPENLIRLFKFRKVMSNREECYKLVNPNHEVIVTSEWDEGSQHIKEGHFLSPFGQHLPGILPEACKKAHFQIVLPQQWKRGAYKPVVIHLAGTGDHSYWRRKNLLATPLLKEYGIASIIIENPFYGARKPPEQRRSSLLNVSDLFVMGACLMLECMVLLHWCEKKSLGPLGLTGISMGGHMASLAASVWPRPIPLIPCLSWTTASGVFTQGVLSGAINWKHLEQIYLDNPVFRDQLFNLVHSPEGHFSIYHEVGLQFARDFPSSMDHIEDIVVETDATSKTPAAEQPSPVVNASGTPAKDDNNNNTSRTTDGDATCTVNDKNSGDNSDMLNSTNNGSFPPQFSHVDSQSNVLSAYSGFEINMKSGGGKLETNTIGTQRESGDKVVSNEESEDLKLIRSSGSGSSYFPGGLESIRQDVPAIISSAFSNTTKPGGIVGKRITSLSPLITGNNKNVITDENVSEKEEQQQRAIIRSNTSEVSNIFSYFYRGKGSSMKEKLCPDDRHYGLTPIDIRPEHALHMPHVKRFRPAYVKVKRAATWEAMQFMRGIMDECTHLKNYPEPVDTELIIIVQAIKDAYQPVESIMPLNEVWPGCELRTLQSGHIQAHLFHLADFRQAINDAFQRAYAKHRHTEQWTQRIGSSPI